MAINLLTQYPGKVGPVVPGDWPYGEPRNITAPSDGTGTPWEAALVKDIIGLQHALLASGVIVPSGTPEKSNASEYLQALVALASGRAFNYDDGGVADAYVADLRSGQQFCANLFDGLRIRLSPVNVNTGPSTLDYNGTIDAIKNKTTGAALVGGEFLAGVEREFVFDGTDWLLEVDSRIVIGTHTFTAVAAATTATIDITHGLGTDNILFGAVVYGGSAWLSGGSLVSAHLLAPNKSSVYLRNSAGVHILITTLPATGDLTILVRNGDASAQDCIIDYWIRARN